MSDTPAESVGYFRAGARVRVACRPPQPDVTGTVAAVNLTPWGTLYHVNFDTPVHFRGDNYFRFTVPQGFVFPLESGGSQG